MTKAIDYHLHKNEITGEMQQLAYHTAAFLSSMNKLLIVRGQF